MESRYIFGIVRSLLQKVFAQIDMKPFRLAQTSSQRVSLPYRPSVGIMLINAEGKVWTGCRRPKWMSKAADQIWQMPQGGILKFETPRAAAFRELAEETGIRKVEIIGEIPRCLTYDLPPELLGIALKGRYRGQRQWWFAMRFLGEDRDISVAARPGQKAEFDDWAWRCIDELPGLVVPFKRGIYETVIREFRHLAQPVDAAAPV